LHLPLLLLRRDARGHVADGVHGVAGEPRARLRERARALALNLMPGRRERAALRELVVTELLEDRPRRRLDELVEHRVWPAARNRLKLLVDRVLKRVRAERLLLNRAGVAGRQAGAERLLRDLPEAELLEARQLCERVEAGGAREH